MSSQTVFVPTDTSASPVSIRKKSSENQVVSDPPEQLATFSPDKLTTEEETSSEDGSENNVLDKKVEELEEKLVELQGKLERAETKKESEIFSPE